MGCLAALGGPTEEELLELLDQCDLALTRTPDSTPRTSTCRYARARSLRRSVSQARACDSDVIHAASCRACALSACLQVCAKASVRIELALRGEEEEEEEAALLSAGVFLAKLRPRPLWPSPPETRSRPRDRRRPPSPLPPTDPSASPAPARTPAGRRSAAGDPGGALWLSVNAGGRAGAVLWSAARSWPRAPRRRGVPKARGGASRAASWRRASATTGRPPPFP